MNYIIYEYMKSRLDFAPTITVIDNMTTSVKNNIASLIIAPQTIRFDKRQTCEMLLRTPKNRTSQEYQSVVLDVLETMRIDIFEYKDVIISFDYDVIQFNGYDTEGNNLYLITYSVTLKKGRNYE